MRWSCVRLAHSVPIRAQGAGRRSPDRKDDHALPGAEHRGQAGPSALRERLQKVALPVAFVFSIASGEANATMRISPVTQS